MSSSSQDKPDIILLMIVSGHYTTALFCVIILLIIIPQPWIWPLICNISWYPCQRWTLSQRFVWAGREWVEMFREEKVVTQRHPRHLMTPGWHLMTLWPSCCQTRAGPDTSPVARHCGEAHYSLTFTPIRYWENMADLEYWNKIGSDLESCILILPFTNYNNKYPNKHPRHA